MITVKEALELIDAINDYGDKERLYGVADGARNPSEVIDQRDREANKALDVVRRCLRPHVEDPDHPSLTGQYDVP